MQHHDSREPRIRNVAIDGVLFQNEGDSRQIAAMAATVARAIQCSFNFLCGLIVRIHQRLPPGNFGSTNLAEHFGQVNGCD